MGGRWSQLWTAARGRCPAGRARARRGRRGQDAAAHGVRPPRPRRRRRPCSTARARRTRRCRTSRSPRPSTTCSPPSTRRRSIRRFGDAGAELARLRAPAGRRPRAAASRSAHGDPDAERARLFGAVIATLAELARTQPVLLVLDDLHWARRPTIDLLDQLVQRPGADATCSSSCSYRSAPADIGEALRVGAARSAPLARRDPAARCTGFDVDGDRGLRGGRRRPPRRRRTCAAAVDELARQTDGNVFLLVELWQHLIDIGQPRAGRASGGRSPVRWPTSSARGRPRGRRRAASAASTRRPGRLLEMAAVIGPTFDPAVLAAAPGEPVGAVLAALDAAARSRIVGEYGAGGYRFAHELIRRSVYDDLGSAERRAPPPRRRRALDAARPTGGLGRPRSPSTCAAAVPLVEPAEVAVAAAVRAADAATEARGLRRRRPLPRGGAGDRARRAASTCCCASPTPRCAPATWPGPSSAASRPTTWPSATATRPGGSPRRWRTARRRGATPATGSTAARLLRGVLAAGRRRDRRGSGCRRR